jgi:general stress protein YciG
MDKDKQRAIASEGGKAAHEAGTAHEFSREEARKAGRRGGLESGKRKREAQEAEPDDEREVGT